MNEIEVYQGSQLVPGGEVVEGELIDNRYVPPEPEYCPECGHFHVVDGYCPDPNRPCGSYLCCIG